MKRTPEQIIEELKANHYRYKDAVKAVRGTWEWSAEKKREELGAVYGEAKETYNQLATEYREAVRQAVEDGRRAVFAPPRVSSDGGINAMNYRTALEAVGKAEKVEEVKETLELAGQIGDEALSKACLYRAYSMGAENIVHEYFRQHPDELPKWDAFMAAAEASNKLEKLGMDMSTGIPAPDRPQELAYANQLPGYPPN